MKRVFGLFLAAALAFCAPACAQTQTATPNSAASNVTVSGPHVIFGFDATPKTPIYVMIFDSATDPADGPVSPAACFYVTPHSDPAATLAMANTPAAIPVVNGLVVVASTTGCYTKTETPAFLSVVWQ